MEEPTEKHKTVQKPRRSGGQLLVVAVLSAGLGILGTLFAQDLIEVITPVALTVLLTLFAVGVLLYLAITFYRDKIIRYLFGEDIHFDSALTDAQDMVKQTIIGTTEAIPGLDPSKKKQLQQAAPRMANFLIWSRFRSQGLRMMVGFMVAIGGLATTILLFNQNKLLERQNEKIDMQMSLEESNRRSAMMSQMANVLDKIDEELRDTFNTNHGTRRLSSQLIGRVASLSHSLKPYQYLDGDSLSQQLSPERGQFLTAILSSKLDTGTLIEIYRKTTFKQADLQSIVLKDCFLVGVDLRGASLANSTLDEVNLSRAQLANSSFKSAVLLNVNLSSSNLNEVDFRFVNNTEAFKAIRPNPAYLDFIGWKEILDTIIIEKERSNRELIVLDYSHADNGDFRHANLNFASLFQASSNNSDFRDASFNLANIREASFVGSNLHNASLMAADLSWAHLSHAKLSKANFSHTTLRNADLHGADLRNSSFKNPVLKNCYLDKVRLKGSLGLEKEELSKVRTLYECTGLPQKTRKILFQDNPELFEKPVHPEFRGLVNFPGRLIQK